MLFNIFCAKLFTFTKSSEKRIFLQLMISYEVVIAVKNMNGQVHTTGTYNENVYHIFNVFTIITKVRMSAKGLFL